jgi:hypothetical protein
MNGTVPRTRDDGDSWIDTLGHGSEYDYDPVWRRCGELGVSPAFHGIGYGWGSRRSSTNACTGINRDVGGRILFRGNDVSTLPAPTRARLGLGRTFQRMELCDSLTVFDLEFFVDLVRLAKRFGFMVIHDFAYGDVCFDDYRAPSFLSVPGAKDVGVETTTMSKGYNMAGWRIGFCAGNAEMIRALATIKGYYDYGMFQALQIAAIVALRECDELVTNQALEYAKRRDVLVDGLRRIGWEAETPKAGMFVWAKYPLEWRQKLGSIDFAMKLLEEAEVAVSPGRGFGEAGEGYLRLALVENEHRLRQAVRQIARCLRAE